MRKNPEPNYGLMLKSAVTALQGDYNLLKNAQIESIRWTWFDSDGNYVELSGGLERLRKIEVLYDRVANDLKEVEKYRTKLDEVE